MCPKWSGLLLGNKRFKDMCMCARRRVYARVWGGGGDENKMTILFTFYCKIYFCTQNSFILKGIFLFEGIWCQQLSKSLYMLLYSASVHSSPWILHCFVVSQIRFTIAGRNCNFFSTLWKRVRVLSHIVSCFPQFGKNKTRSQEVECLLLALYSTVC